MTRPGEGLTVALVTHNSAGCIEAALASVARTLPAAEVVVVDNASTDGTLAAVKRAAPEAVLVRLGENVGYGRACNVAARAARGEHLLFQNPDVVLQGIDPETLAALLADERFGLVAPVLESKGPRGPREVALAAEPSWLRDLGATTLEPLRPRELQGMGKALHRPPRAGRPAWANGALLLVRREEFLAVGGFDRRFFLYYEDRDLSARYAAAGLPLRATRALAARHAPGRSSAGEPLRVEPTGWALLGWLQYLHIWRGPRAAARAAGLALASLRTTERALSLAARVSSGGSRSVRKHEQFARLLDFLREQAVAAREQRHDFCPDALRLLAPRLLGAKAARNGRRIEVLGCPVDSLTLAETLARCERAVRQRRPFRQVSVNAAKLVSLRSDERLRDIVEASDLVSADGQAVVWAARLLGDPLPERVAGIDLMEGLLGLAERRGHSVYLLGARPDVLEEAVTEVGRRYPRLRLAGYRDGYFAPGEEAEVCRAIREAAPDILFVALGSPAKEYFLDRFQGELGVPFAMGVGGAVDVLAGRTRRAPRWLQLAGLEWLYRLLQEPRRLWRRYLSTNTRFGLLLGSELVRRRLRPRPSRAPTA